MPVKKKQKKEPKLEPIQIYKKLKKLQSQLIYKLSDLEDVEEDAREAQGCIEENQSEIDCAEADLKLAQTGLKNSIKELIGYNNQILSIRSELIKMSLNFADALEKSTLPPPKPKKHKKKRLAPVIPFVAPDVLESRSEV